MKRITLFVLLALVAVVAVGAVSAQDMTYSESPYFADMELPPVAERLPVNPKVETPVNEIGAYSDQMLIGFTGTNPGWGGLWYITGWENLVIWKPDFSGIEPNIAESWEVNDDATEYTFHLREGMKWSDGMPFTTEDIMFYVEDVMGNEELNATGRDDWLPENFVEGFSAEAIDETTFVFKFDQPYGGLLLQLPTWGGRRIAWYPKHYLSQFHIKYNPDGVDAMVEAEDGVEDWIGLFNKKASGPSDDHNNYFTELGRPLLYPWLPATELGAGTQMEMVRNPYYWKVDPEGNQLPYVDKIIGISYQDDQSRTLAMISGDLDYIKDAGDENRVLYFDAVADGAPLVITDAYSESGVSNSVHFNMTIDDPVLAEIFGNKDFRIGMSHAINREEMSELFDFGLGAPAQPSPLESSPMYNEQLTNQFTEYNVDLANEYLDKVLPDKDADGYRLRPDGERLSIIFTVSNDLGYGVDWVNKAEVLIGYWDAVGVEVVLNAIANEVFVEARDNNTIQASLYTGEGGAGITPLLDPRYYVPSQGYFGIYGMGWYNWRSEGADFVGVEPPEHVKEVYAMWEDVQATIGLDNQIEKMKDILQIAADDFYVLGTNRPAPTYQVFHQRLGNQPDGWIKGWNQGVEKLNRPETWYIIQ